MGTQSVDTGRLVDRIAQCKQARLEGLSGKERVEIRDFLVQAAQGTGDVAIPMQDRVVVILQPESQESGNFIVWIIAIIANQLYIIFVEDVTPEQIKQGVERVREARYLAGYLRECADIPTREFYRTHFMKGPQGKFGAFNDAKLSFHLLLTNDLRLGPQHDLEASAKRCTFELEFLTRQRDDSVRQRMALAEELAQDSTLQERERLDVRERELEREISIVEGQLPAIHANLARVRLALATLNEDAALMHLEGQTGQKETELAYLSRREGAITSQLKEVAALRSVYERLNRLAQDEGTLTAKIKTLGEGKLSGVKWARRELLVKQRTGKIKGREALAEKLSQFPLPDESEPALRIELGTIQQQRLAARSAVQEINRDVKMRRKALAQRRQEQAVEGTSIAALEAKGIAALGELEVGLQYQVFDKLTEKVALKRELRSLREKRKGLPCNQKQKELESWAKYEAAQTRQIAALTTKSGLFAQALQLKRGLLAMGPLFTWNGSGADQKATGIDMVRFRALARALELDPESTQADPNHADDWGYAELERQHRNWRTPQPLIVTR